MNQNKPDSTNPQTPSEFRALEAALDDLGARSRAHAPSHLENSIKLATRRALTAKNTQPTQPTTIARIRRPLAVAAALLLAGAAITTIALSIRKPVPTGYIIAQIEQDLEDWFTDATNWTTESLSNTDEVTQQVAALEASLTSPWPEDNTFDDLIEESI